MVLVKGEDAEIIAMDLSKVGIIYHCLLKNTIRAKEVFNESINLTSAMTEHGKLYSNPWYVLNRNKLCGTTDFRLQNEKIKTTAKTCQ